MPDNQGQTVDCAGKMAYQKSEARVATNEPAPLTDNPHVGGAGMALEAHTRSETVPASSFRELSSSEELRRFFAYDPETGDFWFKERGEEDFEKSTSPPKSAKHFNNTYAGTLAMTAQNKLGYRVGRVDKRIVLAHRVAWKIHYGEDPGIIDHINGDPSDNRIANLRWVSVADNSKNLGLSSKNRTGISSIIFNNPSAKGKKWRFFHPSSGEPSKSFYCIGKAVKHRNSVLGKYGFTPSHGVRLSYTEEIKELRDKSARDNTDQIKNIEEREAGAKSPKSDWQPIGDVTAEFVRAASYKRGGDR